MPRPSAAPPASTFLAQRCVAGRYDVVGALDSASNRGRLFTFAGRDRETGDGVLICQLKPLFARDPNVRRELAEGVAKSALLSHPSIREVLASEIGDGTAFYVTRSLDGQTVSRRLRGGAIFTEREVVLTAKSLLGALVHAHERGVVFGGIKPSNVLLRPSRCEGMLVDLPRPPLDVAGLTHAAAYLEIPQDCAPEVLATGRFDARADLYGVGVVMWQMATGTLAFRDHPNLADVLSLVIEEGLPPAESVNPDLHPALARLIARATARDPEERFVSAAAMFTALGKLPTRNAPLVSPQRLDALVRSSFPQPIARTYASIDERAGEDERLGRLIDTTHVAVQLVASLVIMDRHRQGLPPLPLTKTPVPFARPALGHWVSVVRANALDPTGVLPQLHRALLEDDQHAHLLRTAMDRLVEVRNQCRHGSSLPAAGSRRLRTDAKPHLLTMLRQLLLLRDHTLVVVDDIDFADEGFEYVVRPLRGMVASQLQVRVRAAERFKQHHLCFADHDLVPRVDLYPLVRWKDCPRCDTQEVFFYESAGDERVHYVSYDHGHSMSDPDILPAFRTLGLL